MPSAIPQHKPPRTREPGRYGRQATRYLHTGSATWRRIRATQLARFPTCEDCAAHGVLTVATEVDHNTGDTSRNVIGVELSSLCKPCHSRRTRAAQTEKSRGTEPPRHARPALDTQPRKFAL